MDQWTNASASSAIHDFDKAPLDRQNALIEFLNENYPPSVFAAHLDERRKALVNTREAKEVLNGVSQEFPPFISYHDNPCGAADLRGCALILTAGGEGERLKTSLIKQGVSESSLNAFTKATYALPGFYGDFGALQANLCLISYLSKTHGLKIPVVITTGPKGSMTARVIPELLQRHASFGLSHIRVIEQDERLHFTMDEKIVSIETGGKIAVATHPDETGGPLMKLKAKDTIKHQSALDWFGELRAGKILVLQATGLYEPKTLFHMAAALKNHDCVGVGILRSEFTENDPFGTYVATVKNGVKKVVIVEQDIRNQATLRVKDATHKYYLPYNTGLYAFSCGLLEHADLPDYATPPKEISSLLPRSPKIGYAATDLFSLSKNPAVLCIPRDWFEVIKNADDLQKLSDLGKRFGIDKMCEGVR